MNVVRLGFPFCHDRAVGCSATIIVLGCGAGHAFIFMGRSACRAFGRLAEAGVTRRAIFCAGLFYPVPPPLGRRLARSTTSQKPHGENMSHFRIRCPRFPWPYWPLAPQPAPRVFAGVGVTR